MSRDSTESWPKALNVLRLKIADVNETIGWWQPVYFCREVEQNISFFSKFFVYASIDNIFVIWFVISWLEEREKKKILSYKIALLLEEILLSDGLEDYHATYKHCQSETSKLCIAKRSRWKFFEVKAC